MRPQALTGHRMTVGKGSSRDAENLPSLCQDSHYTPSLHYYVEAVVIVVCILKNFCVKMLV